MKLNFENKEEVQKEFDALTDACNKQSTELKANGVAMEEAKMQIVNLTAGSVGLAGTIKAIHLLLGRKSDLFKDDKQMNELMREIATFVVSSGAIKLGVLSHAMDKENESN